MDYLRHPDQPNLLSNPGPPSQPVPETHITPQPGYCLPEPETPEPPAYDRPLDVSHAAAIQQAYEQELDTTPDAAAATRPSGPDRGTIDLPDELAYGEVVGPDHTPPYDRAMATTPNALVLGRDTRDVDTALYHVVAERIEDLNASPSPRPRNVVVADFAVGEPPALVAHPIPDQYKAVTGGVASKEGLLSLFSPEQQARALAAAAAGDNINDVRTYGAVLTPLARALSTPSTGPDGQQRQLAPPPDELRDAVRYNRDMRVGPQYPGEVVSLGAPWQIPAIKDAFSPPRRETLRPAFEPLGQFLDHAIPETGTTEAYEVVAPPVEQPPLTTVSHITAEGMPGGEREAQIAVLTHAVVVLASDPDAPKVDLLVLRNPDKADQPTLKQIYEHSAAKGIGIVAVVSELTDDTSWLAGESGAIGFARVRPKEAAALSAAQGVELRDEESSFNEARHGNLGTGDHQGRNANYGEYSTPKGSGTSGSSDWQIGASYDQGRTITRSESPRHRQSHIESVGPGEFCVIGPDKVGRVYHIGSREFVRLLTPPQASDNEIPDRIKAIEGAVGQRHDDHPRGDQGRVAIGTAPSNPSQPGNSLVSTPSPGGVAPLPEPLSFQPTLLQPHGEFNLISGAFDREHGGTFNAVARIARLGRYIENTYHAQYQAAEATYLKQKALGQTDLPWEEWHGGHLDAKTWYKEHGASKWFKG